MSTLGTFAKYADFKTYRLASKGNPIERAFQGKGRLTGKNAVDIINEGVQKVNAPKRKAVMRRDPSTQIVPMKSAQPSGQGKGGALTWELPDARNARAKVGRSKMALPAGEDKKKSNLGLILGLAGGGAALAGGGAATAIALANRKKKKASPETEAKMSSPHGLSSFAAEDPFKTRTKGQTDAAMKGIRTKEKQYWAESFGKADDEKKAAMKKETDKYLRQRNIENQLDAKDGIGKTYNKGGLKDAVNVTTALAGQPERKLVQAGKSSSNKFVRDLAEGAESFGRAGYRAGAVGGQKIINKIVGRTATGKLARLGAAGTGLAVIGGAMRRNRQEEN